MDKHIATLEGLVQGWRTEAQNYVRDNYDEHGVGAIALKSCANQLDAAIALMRGQSEGVIRLPELPEQDVEGVRFDGFSISAMEDFARRAVAMNERSCVWTIDADPYAEMWNGACGIAWTFTEGGPADNECNHCPKCGGRIEITDRPKDSADEQ